MRGNERQQEVLSKLWEREHSIVRKNVVSGGSVELKIQQLLATSTVDLVVPDFEYDKELACEIQDWVVALFHPSTELIDQTASMASRVESGDKEFFTVACSHKLKHKRSCCATPWKIISKGRIYQSEAGGMADPSLSDDEPVLLMPQSIDAMLLSMRQSAMMNSLGLFMITHYFYSYIIILTNSSLPLIWFSQFQFF